MNRTDLAKKAGTVASDLLRAKGYISFVDVFMSLGVLSKNDYETWRMRRVPYLERVIRLNLNAISFVMKHVRQTSLKGKLRESWTGYASSGKGTRVPLRFSKSGEHNIERTYATHFVLTKEVREIMASRKKKSGEPQLPECRVKNLCDSPCTATGLEGLWAGEPPETRTRED